MVECKNITVTLGRNTIVDNVSFNVNQGEICVILGQNGSGKTTLLRALNHNVPYTGEVNIDGQDIKNLTLKQRAFIMASMPQILPQPPVTVERLVSFGRQPFTGMSGILSAKDKEIVEKVLAENDLKNLAHKRIDKISGGERRKAFFAMMLCQGAKVLLADEPTANLDVQYTKHILNAFAKQKEKNNTIITVLHDINQALEIADRIIVMQKGRNVFDGTPLQACDENIPLKYFNMEKLKCTDKDGKEFFMYR